MTNNNVTWWEKFSPTVMETEVPQKFIDIINNTGDEVLKDDGLSKKYDFSDNLVGKVHKEVSIPVPDKDKSYCLSILRQACVRYLIQMIEKVVHMSGVKRLVVKNLLKKIYIYLNRG